MVAVQDVPGLPTSHKVRFVGAAGNGCRRSKRRGGSRSVFLQDVDAFEPSGHDTPLQQAGEVYPVLAPPQSLGCHGRLFEDALLKQQAIRSAKSVEVAKEESRQHRLQEHYTALSVAQASMPKHTQGTRAPRVDKPCAVRKQRRAKTERAAHPKAPRLMRWTHTRQTCAPPPGSYLNDKGQTVVPTPEEQRRRRQQSDNASRNRRSPHSKASSHCGASTCATQKGAASVCDTDVQSVASHDLSSIGSMGARQWKTATRATAFAGAGRGRYIHPQTKSKLRHIQSEEDAARNMIFLEARRLALSMGDVFHLHSDIFAQLRELVGDEPPLRCVIEDEEVSDREYLSRYREMLAGIVSSVWYVVDSECQLRYALQDAEHDAFRRIGFRKKADVNYTEECVSERLLKENVLMRKSMCYPHTSSGCRVFLCREVVGRQLLEQQQEAAWQVMVIGHSHMVSRDECLGTDALLFGVLYTVCTSVALLYSEEEEGRAALLQHRTQAGHRLQVYFANRQVLLEGEAASRWSLLQVQELEWQRVCLDVQAHQTLSSTQGEALCVVARLQMRHVDSTEERLLRAAVLCGEQRGRVALRFLRDELRQRHAIVSAADRLPAVMSLQSAEDLHRRQAVLQEQRAALLLLEMQEAIARRRFHHTTDSFLATYMANATQRRTAISHKERHGRVEDLQSVEAACRHEVEYAARRALARVVHRGERGLLAVRVLRRCRRQRLHIQQEEAQHRYLLVAWLDLQQQEAVLRREVAAQSCRSARKLLPYHAALNRRHVQRQERVQRWWLETSLVLSLHECTVRDVIVLKHKRHLHRAAVRRLCGAEALQRCAVAAESREELAQRLRGWSADANFCRLYEAEARRRRALQASAHTSHVTLGVVQRHLDKHRALLHEEVVERCDAAAWHLLTSEGLRRDHLACMERHMRHSLMQGNAVLKVSKKGRRYMKLHTLSAQHKGFVFDTVLLKFRMKAAAG